MIYAYANRFMEREWPPRCRKKDFSVVTRNLSGFSWTSGNKSGRYSASEEVRNPVGYFAYFSSSKDVKDTVVSRSIQREPLKVEYGIGIKEFDDEGRIVMDITMILSF